MKKTILVATIALSSFYLQGCATGATAAGMTSAKTFLAGNSAMANKIEVEEVTGGSITLPFWTSQVGNGATTDALKASLKKSGLLAPKNTKGAYVLMANLNKISHPIMGLDATVKAEVRYVLKDVNINQDILRKTVKTSYTAKWGDSIWGVKRLRLANEGVMRVNIEELLGTLTSAPNQ